MTTTTAIPAGTILSDGLIEACGDRASAYDRENRFFEEDWAALRAAGFLTANVPAELGGGGLNLSRTCHGAGDEHAPLLDDDGGRHAPLR
jgi:hypothetical protein